MQTCMSLNVCPSRFTWHIPTQDHRQHNASRFCPSQAAACPMPRDRAQASPDAHTHARTHSAERPLKTKGEDEMEDSQCMRLRAREGLHNRKARKLPHCRPLNSRPLRARQMRGRDCGNAMRRHRRQSINAGECRVVVPELGGACARQRHDALLEVFEREDAVAPRIQALDDPRDLWVCRPKAHKPLR